ncbi:MAG: hypothetical protein ACREH4_03965, partial [Vitreimonas sp.]
APGREDAAATTDSTILERVRMPPQFQAAVQATAVAGTTILLTHARVAVDDATIPAPSIAEGDGSSDGSVQTNVPVFDMER